MKTIDTKSFLDTLCTLCEEGKTVSTVVEGGSMLPFLSPGRDYVFLNKITKAPKRGDIILYKRKNGDYILHRIQKVRNGEYFLVGDRQTQVEGGIKKENLCAIVTEVRRKDKILNSKSPVWFFYKHIWLSLLRFRPFLLKLKRNITK